MLIDALRRVFGRREPSGRGEIEAAGEYPVTAWENLGQGRAGAAERYHLGPDDGVRVSPTPVTAASRVRIAYSGLLAGSGAQTLYLRCGEGPGPWRNVRDVRMERVPATGEWEAEVQAGEERGTLEFCFHDGAGNWDNNGGRNWSVTVHGGRPGGN